VTNLVFDFVTNLVFDFVTNLRLGRPDEFRRCDESWVWVAWRILGWASWRNLGMKSLVCSNFSLIVFVKTSRNEHRKTNLFDSSWLLTICFKLRTKIFFASKENLCLWDAHRNNYKWVCSKLIRQLLSVTTVHFRSAVFLTKCCNALFELWIKIISQLCF